ncbi:hypothetical protein [Ectopseudomonas composti]|uniref:hypothetical protein n=1 Tax=Ectopseudomonas composti TaxID=658457 RepID=UPI000773764B|nr:hypothetical protein [Pseudomonas composti]
MLRLALLAVLLTGCAAQPEPYQVAFSRVSSERVMERMEFCAKAVSEIPLPLDDEAKNAIYSDCLIQVGATI